MTILSEYLDNIQEKEILSEDLVSSLIGVAIGMGIILIPHFIHQAKLKRAAKATCTKFEGNERRNCVIRHEIGALRKEKAGILAGKCNPIKIDPIKCEEVKSKLAQDIRMKIDKLKQQLR
jgi:hypothetical protein